jgi:hypothetical protein
MKRYQDGVSWWQRSTVIVVCFRLSLAFTPDRVLGPGSWLVALPHAACEVVAAIGRKVVIVITIDLVVVHCQHTHSTIHCFERVYTKPTRTTPPR